MSTKKTTEYAQNHLIYGLMDDLLIYVFNFLEIDSIFELKLTSKYLNKTITANNECFYHLSMKTLESLFNNTTETQKSYQIMQSFQSIHSLETLINFNRLFPLNALQQNEKYQKSKLAQEMPPQSFYDEFITDYLSKLHRLERLVINGCFNEISNKLPFQPRLKILKVRNTEASNLLSSFFHRLLQSQFDVNTAIKNKENKDTNDINAWCNILSKAGCHTLNKLKLDNFTVSIKTLYILSKFVSLHTFEMQYDFVNFEKDEKLLENDQELNEKLDILQRKMTFVYPKESKWHNLEVLICLFLKNVICLNEVCLFGDEMLSSSNNTLCLLMFFYLLRFHGNNLHALNVRLCVNECLKYDKDYEEMRIYDEIIRHSFDLNGQLLNSLRIQLNDSKQSIEQQQNEQEEENKTMQDIDDVIIKYGNKQNMKEYVASMPLCIQMFLSLFDRYKMCSNLNMNLFDFVFESCSPKFGFFYGLLIAKGIVCLRPMQMNVSANLSAFDERDRELFVCCMQSMAKWTLLFNDRNGLNTFKVCISCLNPTTVKELSEFCVGDGTDLRLIQCLEMMAKNLKFANIDFKIETLLVKNEIDKLRYYMRIEALIKRIGFKVNLDINDNSQSLDISFKSKQIDSKMIRTKSNTCSKMMKVFSDL